MYEKFRLYLTLIEFPVFLVDILRIFLCVFSLNILAQDGRVFQTNAKSNSSYSICVNYCLLLIDCVLFYFIKFNRITFILFLRIGYLLICVSLIMVLISQSSQQITKDCVLKPLSSNKDDLMSINKDLVGSSTNNKLNVVYSDNRLSQSKQKKASSKKKKRKNLRQTNLKASNCSSHYANFRNKKTNLNQISNVPLNFTKAYNLKSDLKWSNDCYNFNVKLYFKYTEIILIILSMVVYLLSIFTIDIYFLQIPYS